MTTPSSNMSAADQYASNQANTYLQRHGSSHGQACPADGKDGADTGFDELDAGHAEPSMANDVRFRQAMERNRDMLDVTRMAVARRLGLRTSEDDGSATSNQLSDVESTSCGPAEMCPRQSRLRDIRILPGPLPYQFDNQAESASGSSGYVRKATSDTTGEVVAIKTMDCHNADGKDGEAAAREIEMVKVCHHPNVVELVDVYMTIDRVHLVIKPWAPFTLHAFLVKDDESLSMSCPWFVPGQQSSMDIVVRLLSDLADGLRYLHLKKIKHKDIKPENILLCAESSEDIRPIIADFGSSKPYNRKGDTNYIDSTYPYLAPEQFSETESSLKSDVWQLGCCFAQILTRACGGNTARRELAQSYENTKEARSCAIALELEHFMPALRHLCASMPDVLNITCGMMEKDPNKRWSIAHVREELARVMRLPHEHRYRALASPKDRIGRVVGMTAPTSATQPSSPPVHSGPSPDVAWGSVVRHHQRRPSAPPIRQLVKLSFSVRRQTDRFGARVAMTLGPQTPVELPERVQANSENQNQEEDIPPVPSLYDCL